jgi:hypothetical protein
MFKDDRQGSPRKRGTVISQLVDLGIVVAVLEERDAARYRHSPLTCSACGREVDVSRSHVLVRDPTDVQTDDEAFVCVLHEDDQCIEKYEDGFYEHWRSVHARRGGHDVQG